MRTLGTIREQLEHRTDLLWPLPFLFLPLEALFFGILSLVVNKSKTQNYQFHPASEPWDFLSGLCFTHVSLSTKFPAKKQSQIFFGTKRVPLPWQQYLLIGI